MKSPALLLLTITVFFTSSFIPTQAQDAPSVENSAKNKPQTYEMGHYLNHRLHLKAGYKYMNGLNIELNYAFLNILEIGLYTGIDRYYAKKDPDSIYTDDMGKIHPVYRGTEAPPSPFALLMGANLNIHLLPLFLQQKKPRFDLYISNKFYTAYAFIPKQFAFKTRFLPFHAETGLGFSCYFTPKFGMYIEGSYQYQNIIKADIISSYKDPDEFGGRGKFHGRIGFVIRIK